MTVRDRRHAKRRVRQKTKQDSDYANNLRKLHRVLGWCVSHTKELLVDWNLARQGKEPKWIDWTID